MSVDEEGGTHKVVASGFVVSALVAARGRVVGFSVAVSGAGRGTGTSEGLRATGKGKGAAALGAMTLPRR